MDKQPHKKILVLDDSTTFPECIRQLAEPEFTVVCTDKIQDAYWMYVRNPGDYGLVILDFNLEANRSRSNFDGIDFVAVVEVGAKNQGLPTPWIVALTAASDDLVECFFNASTNSPLLELISKGMGANHVVDQLKLLFSALQENDPSKFKSAKPRPKRFIPKIELDEENLKRLSKIYSDRGEKHFRTLAQNIGNQVFSTYRSLEFSALAPGYSGSEVLSVVASRTDDFDNARTFVVKLCRSNDVIAVGKLAKESRNYFDHAYSIREYVPLLTGPFQTKGWHFIVYEFIFVEGYGVSTFADYLTGTIEQPDVTTNTFRNNFSRRHSDFIFDRILKEWHESHEYSEEEPNTRFLYRDEKWVSHFRKAAARRIIAVYEDLESQLKKPLLRMDLDLTPQPLVLANPLNVLDKLLSDKSYEYFLSAGVVHGDLHSGNIIRSLRFFTGKWMLIDFANVETSAHLAQDGARLEWDIKLNHFRRSLRPRFTLEVELAKSLDELLARKLGDVLDLEYWSNRWKVAPMADQCVSAQIMDIRDNTFKRIEYRKPRDPGYSPYVDYTVSLLMQSLMFVGYTRNPIKTLHAWLGACLAATLISHHSEVRSEQRVQNDMEGRSTLGPRANVRLVGGRLVPNT